MKKEDLIRYKFDGLNSEIFRWEVLTPTAFTKEEFKLDKVEKEMVLAYLRASELICMNLINENNPAFGLKIIKDNPVCMPFLFLCRHTIELSIKLRLEYEHVQNVSGHKLSKIYNKLLKFKPEIEKCNDLKIIIDVLDLIDNDGCKLRYSKDKNGKVYQEQPIFINPDKIMIATKKACEYLISPALIKKSGR